MRIFERSRYDNWFALLVFGLSLLGWSIGHPAPRNAALDPFSWTAAGVLGSFVGMSQNPINVMLILAMAATFRVNVLVQVLLALAFGSLNICLVSSWWSELGRSYAWRINTSAGILELWTMAGLIGVAIMRTIFHVRSRMRSAAKGGV